MTSLTIRIPGSGRFQPRGGSPARRRRGGARRRSAVVGEVVLLGGRHCMGGAVGGTPDHLEGTPRGVGWYHHADHAHGGRAKGRQLVHEGHVDPDQPDLHQPLHHRSPLVALVLQARRPEGLAHHHDAPVGRLIHDRRDLLQVVFEPPPQVGQRLPASEVGGDAVTEPKPGPGSGDRDAEGGEVMFLPEGPAECGLPTPVGPGDHQEAFRAGQVEVVDHGVFHFGHQPGRQDQGEGPDHSLLSGSGSSVG